MGFSRMLFYAAGFIVMLCHCNISADYPTSPSFSVSPSQPSYNNGQKITMMCSPPNNTNVEKIRYFKNLTEIHFDEKKETMNHYIVIISKKEDEGVYWCGYWVKSNGTKKLSYGSNSVNIMITDSTPSWIYYIAGGVIFFAVIFFTLLSCLLYKITQKRKNPSRASRTNLTYRNPGHSISKEPVKKFPLSPSVQNQLNNPIYSVICQHPTPASEQLLSADANTGMGNDLKGPVPKSFKTSLASVPNIFQEQEEAHIYHEIETEIFPNN